MAVLERRRRLEGIRSGEKPRLEQHDGVLCREISPSDQADGKDWDPVQQQGPVNDTVSADRRRISRPQQLENGNWKGLKGKGTKPILIRTRLHLTGIKP